ncbi:MAG: hypothetical protein EZS28_006860 [Streblomastix strix]|uniref:Uncharacterized protein n=1 Tax=Streblomastix strix TaxID=222440 RepID=A0A5J4WU00_9EUKA|nr:MAG: hypothetical protein EZS28_006860 [Streblomastix strix]
MNLAMEQSLQVIGHVKQPALKDRLIDWFIQVKVKNCELWTSSQSRWKVFVLWMGKQQLPLPETRKLRNKEPIIPPDKCTSITQTTSKDECPCPQPSDPETEEDSSGSIKARLYCGNEQVNE